MPRSVIDVEPGIDEFAAGAIINLRPYDIDQAHLFIAELAKRQRQPALSLIGGIIDDDHMAIAVRTSPGIGHKLVMGPVAGPGRQRLDLRPSAIAKNRLFQDSR